MFEKIYFKGNHTDKFTLVDKEDFEFLNSYNWYFERYAINKKIRLHRLVLEKHGLDIKGKIIDHINGDKLDNRKSNLRITDKSINSFNQHTRYKNGYRGVYKRGKYCYCNFKGKATKSFSNIELAAYHFNELVKKHGLPIDLLNKIPNEELVKKEYLKAINPKSILDTEKYIHKLKGITKNRIKNWIFSMSSKSFKFTKYFESREEAVEFRNVFLEENNLLNFNL